MHICRFTTKDAGGPRVGVMRAGAIHDVTEATEALPDLRWPLPPGDQFVQHLPQLTDAMAALADRAPPIAPADVTLLSPVANPGKFVCGMGNWKFHGAPLGMLGFLFKVTSANAGAGEGVTLGWPDRTTLHEPELAMVIGRTCRDVPVDEALDYVAGYTGALDMTMKEEREDFSFCKAFDSYGILGPCLVTKDAIDDPSNLGYRFYVNGEQRGERSFADLTGSPAELVAFASTVMTLYPGDVILSGAADVGPVEAGDMMTLDIPEIGRMDVAVRAGQWRG